MIWATVSSQFCFCWLYRASPSSTSKNIINLISVLIIWWCPCVVSCVVGRGCLLWPVFSIGKTLLAFALVHFVLQGQTCLLLQVSLDFLLLNSNPLWWKGHRFFFFFGVSSRSSLGLHSMCVYVLSSFSRVWLFVTLCTVAHQSPMSKGFSRQEYLSGLPCPPPGDLPNPGIERTSLMSPALAGGFFTTSNNWEAPFVVYYGYTSFLLQLLVIYGINYPILNCLCCD